MQWLMIGVGAVMVALAAMLRLAGGTNDFQAHALPFWLFLIGIVGLFFGGWMRDRAKALAVPAMRNSHMSAMSPVSAVPMAPAVAPQMAPALTGGLSSLQRPTAMMAPAVNVTAMAAAAVAPVHPVTPASTGVADIISRIHALETENSILRAFLLEAKTAIAR